MNTPQTVKGSISPVEGSKLQTVKGSTSNLQPPTDTQPSTPNLQPSTDIAISVRNVSKMYPLYKDPRDRLKQSLWYALPRFLRGDRPPEFYTEFWALRDISFDVKKGETVGIIGRNGSGKSTLLQIIAGTLAPTHGEVQVNGRVAALLELGSGFNPEFTGRENVYMNGAILGLSREEMDERFEDIAAFADIGQFIDQPVKLYSSGMFVRLAFAVAINVDPDILIIDEALAVGDIRFQQKCFRKINEFRERNKAILFVSHDPSAIINFCDNAIWLESGLIHEAGLPKDIVKRYLAFMSYETFADSLQESQRINNLKLPEASQQTLFSIDNLSVGKQYVSITGWGFLPADSIQNENETFLVLKSRTKNIIYSTKSIERPDVSNAYKHLDLHLSRVGFCARIPRNELDEPEYQLYLYIKTKQSEALQSTGYVISLKPEISEKENAGDSIQWQSVDSCESFGVGGARIQGVALYSRDTGEPLNILKGGEQVSFYIKAKIEAEISQPGFGFILKDRLGNPIFSLNNYVYSHPIQPLSPGERIIVRFDFTFPHIMNGEYTISPAIADGTQQSHIQHHWVHDAYSIQVVNNDLRYHLGFLVINETINITTNKI